MQSALIVIVGAVVFGVSWGNPLAAALLVITWALVGAGAGLFSGTFFRTPEQASAIGPTAGIALTHEEIDSAIDEYYRLAGWRPDGIPTAETLQKLDLAWVA